MHDRQALMQRAFVHYPQIYPRAMSNLKRAALAYLRYVLDHYDMSPTALAKAAGISSTTLTRPLNDPDHKHTLSTTTINKLVEFSGISFAAFAEGKTEVDIARNVFRPDAYDEQTWGEHPDEDVGAIAIIGDVAAGHWRELKLTDVMKYGALLMRPSNYTVEESFAVRVVGESINRVARLNDVLLCIRRDAYKHGLHSGDLVVVERRSADHSLIEVSAKRLRGQEGAWQLWPDSNHPDHREPIPLESLDDTTEIVIVGVVLYVVRYPGSAGDDA